MSPERPPGEPIPACDESPFELLARYSSDIVASGDTGGRFRYVSPAVERVLGYEPGELIGRKALEFCHPDELPRLRERLAGPWEGDTVELCLEHRARHRDGGWIWIESRIRLVPATAACPFRWIATQRDIGERKRMQAQLLSEKRRLAATLGSIADGVIAVTEQGLVDYLNPAAERSLGIGELDALGRPLLEVFRPALGVDGPGPEADLDELAAWLTRDGGEAVVIATHDGRQRSLNLSIAPIQGADNRRLGLVLSFRDTGHTTRLLRELSYRASHDSLTGLLNREEFERRLRQLVLDAVNSGLGHALCYVDLDQFKLINDTCGHAAGDALLKEVSATLQGMLDEGDVLARLGGDEFGVLMPGRSTREAVALAQDLVDALARLRFDWNDRQFLIGGSIGVAAITREAGNHQAVLMAADAACYVAKERGRNRVHLFELSDVEVAKRQGQMRWVPRLQTALETSDFRLLAHAIVPTHPEPGPIPARFEVLIALPDASGRLIPPGEFLPAAQRYGLMGRIDRWVVEQVLRWLAQGQGEAAERVDMVAVNLSGSSISDPDFRAFVEDEVRAGHLGPRLCFEITESEAVANLGDVAEFIERMRDLGCRFALDDFGAGLSSFPYLRRLGVDFVKIDGQFVRDMAHDPVSAVMVEAIHRIGKAMGLTTVAEFVETPAIYESVRRIGIDCCQGFHFGRPQLLSTLGATTAVET